MHSPNDHPSKSILKSTHGSGSAYNIHLKRASFKDDPILIQFTEQTTSHAPSVEEPEEDSGTLGECDRGSSSAFTFAVPSARVFERRKSFEEKRKEFYEEDGINVRSLLARPPKELLLADEEVTSIDVEHCDPTSTCLEEGAEELGCRLEKMEVSTSSGDATLFAAPLPPAPCQHHSCYHQNPHPEHPSSSS